MKTSRSDADHWYTRAGQPMHRVVGKNGIERSTTIRDAKKLDLLPSVTSILGLIYKPQLEAWKRKQLIAAIRSMPEGTDEEWLERYEQETGRAADLGTRCHEAIEGIVDHLEFGAGMPEMDADVAAIVESFRDWYVRCGLKAYQTEAYVVGDGYAGKLDWWGTTANGAWLLVDWKTTRSSSGYPMSSWPANGAQLAAYWAACGRKPMQLWNVMVSTTEPGRIEIVDWTDRREEMLVAFRHAFSLWCGPLGKDWTPKLMDVQGGPRTGMRIDLDDDGMMHCTWTQEG